MGMTVRELVTTWGFKVDSKPLDEMDKQVKALKKTVAEAGAAVAATLTAVYVAAKFTSENIISSNRAAAAYGIQTKTLEGLTYAAEKMKISGEAVKSTLDSVSKSLYAARWGDQGAIMGFVKAGVEIRNASGGMKTADQILMDLSARFKNMPDGIEKTGMAVKALGGAGEELIPLLNQGPKAIKQWMRDGEAFYVSNQKNYKASMAFSSAVSEMGFSLKNFRDMIAVEVMPVLTQMIEKMVAWYRANKDTVVQDIASFLRQVVSVMGSVLGVIMKLVDFTVKLAGAFGGLKPVLWAITAALTEMTAVKVITGLQTVLGLVRGIGLAQGVLGAAGGAAGSGTAAAGAAGIGGLALPALAIAGIAAAAAYTTGLGDGTGSASPMELYQKRSGMPGVPGGLSSMNITNKMDIHLPPGTSQQHAETVARSAGDKTADIMRGMALVVAGPVKR